MRWYPLPFVPFIHSAAWNGNLRAEASSCSMRMSAIPRGWQAGELEGARIPEGSAEQGCHNTPGLTLSGLLYEKETSVLGHCYLIIFSYSEGNLILTDMLLH